MTELVSTKLVSNARAAIKRVSGAAKTALTPAAQKTGPLRARFGDRRRGGAGDHLPREELLAGMHHLLPTGMQSVVIMQSSVPRHNAITGMPAMRSRQNNSGADLTFAIRPAANREANVKSKVR
jgi:hypothetical protein